MRRTWWALTAVAVALVVLASVSPPARSQGAGVLRTYTISDVTMNPFTLPQQLATLLVIKPVFDTLTRYRPKDLQPVPGLAASWEASEGGRIWTFKLRKGVKWHDGRPFTAHDVKFTFEGIVNPRVRSLFKAPFRGMQRVEVVDDSTVRVVFEQPNVAFPIALGYNIPIAPRHLLEGKDLNTMPEFVQRPIGTGPFRWKEYVRGSHVVLEANPEYFEGRPKMDTLVFKILPDINTVVAQLRTGELDIGVIEPVHKKALTAVPHLNFLTTDLPSTFYIAMNNSRWQFSDKRVRKALTMAINRELIVKQILQAEVPLAASPWAKAFGPYWTDKIQPYPYSPARAKELLAEAGFRPGPDGILQKDGRRMSVDLMVDKGNPVREQIAATVQHFWKQVGVDVRLDVQEWSVYIRRGNSLPGDYDARTSWRITSPDPDKTAEYVTGGANNHYAYSNPEVDRLMAEAAATLDMRRRVQLYHRIQEIVWEEAPLAWLYYQTEILAVSKRVRGWPQIDFRNGLMLTYQLSVGR